MKTAFVSYNAIYGATPGWNRRGSNEALVLQNSTGQEFAAIQGGPQPAEQFEAGCRIVESEIVHSWKILQENLATFDQVFIYVGTSGSEKAIELAARQLPPEKTTYVLCGCGIGSKKRLIAGLGHANARQIGCECGGQRTMGDILRRFLETGQFS